MKVTPRRFLACAALTSVIGVASSSAATITTDTADARVRFEYVGNTVDNIASGSSNAIEVGSHGAAASEFSSNYVMPFQLPALGAGQTFANATLTVTLDQVSNIVSGETADLYGLDRIDAAPTVVVGDHFEGELDASNTLLQDSIFTEATVVGTVTSVDISAFLNTQYAGGANAGQFVFLRLNRDGQPDGGNNRFRVEPAENGAATIATITYDAVPEPSAAALGLIGVLGMLRRRR